MEFKKAPKDLIDLIVNKMKDKNCDYKKMFGYPAFFVNGNMFVGIHGENLFLRLSDSDIENIKEDFKAVANFEPMPGRAMKGYVVLPKSLYSDDNAFTKWLDKSIDYASSLPQKNAKKKLG